jgi:hypothetical protein
MDVLAFAAAKAAGYDHLTYDFKLVFVPRCTSNGYSGAGWIGAPGGLIFVYANDYDQSVSHEIGHNFGAYHASAMTGGSRGAKAWKDSTSTWSEYGNPHSTMGVGRLANVRADYLLPGKMTFDWITDASIVAVTPFSSTGAGLCNPRCGPYTIYATDSGAKTSGTFLGLQIATATPNLYFFVEHRVSSTAGHAALISWSTVSMTSGKTGTYGNTVNHFYSNTFLSTFEVTLSYLSLSPTPNAPTVRTTSTGSHRLHPINFKLLRCWVQARN